MNNQQEMIEAMQRDIKTAKRLKWVEDAIAFLALIGIGTVLMFFWVVTP